MERKALSEAEIREFETEVSVSQSDAEASESDAPELVVVFVTGEVLSPGVYTFPKGTRIYEAIQAAGGFTEDANRAYINLASVLSDGEQITVPKRGEEAEMTQIQSASDKININTADVQTLMQLPGIGEVKAESIIAYRNEHGLFTDVQDLKKVSGIGDSLYDRLKDKIKI